LPSVRGFHSFLDCSSSTLSHAMRSRISDRSLCYCYKCPPNTILALRTRRDHYRLYGQRGYPPPNSANGASTNVMDALTEYSNGDGLVSGTGMASTAAYSLTLQTREKIPMKLRTRRAPDPSQTKLMLSLMYHIFWTN